MVMQSVCLLVTHPVLDAALCHDDSSQIIANGRVPVRTNGLARGSEVSECVREIRSKVSARQRSAKLKKANLSQSLSISLSVHLSVHSMPMAHDQQERTVVSFRA